MPRQKGFKHSDETKKKISKALMGIDRQPFSEEHKTKLSEITKANVDNGKNRTIFKKGHTINIGRKCSEEKKRKISESHKGVKLSIKHCESISQSQRGKKFSQETKDKISKAMKDNTINVGRKLTNEHKNKISNALKGNIPWSKGKKLSEEHKKKIAEGNRGKKVSEEAKRKISKGRFGKNNPNWRGGTNLNKAKEAQRAWHTKKRATLKGKLEQRMGTAIYKSLKGNKKGRRWESLVGYSLDDLKQQLEKLFAKGMTWGNMGQWHVDHKVPVLAFNFNKPEDLDFKRCWALSNLQPLWAKENIAKRANLEKPFQPSFAF